MMRVVRRLQAYRGWQTDKKKGEKLSAYKDIRNKGHLRFFAIFLIWVGAMCFVSLLAM